MLALEECELAHGAPFEPPGNVSRRTQVKLNRCAAAWIAAACVMIASPEAALAAGPPATHGVPISRCTAHEGTIVAVDFAHWGGPIVRGCALGQPTGYQLLHAAGFTTAVDDRDGPAFICRLGDTAFRHGAQYPTAAQAGCVLTPPASAYWSFWLAAPDQNRWAYSPLGAMTEVPKPGEVELWVFGATNIAGTNGSGVPEFSPDQLRASNPGPTVGSGAPRLADALPTTERASSGSAAPLVIGLGVAVLLGGAGAWTAWRRRRYE